MFPHRLPLRQKTLQTRLLLLVSLREHPLPAHAEPVPIRFMQRWRVVFVRLPPWWSARVPTIAERSMGRWLPVHRLVQRGRLGRGRRQGRPTEHWVGGSRR
jgi:hypothetical protein